MKQTSKLIVVLSIIFSILAIGVMSYATDPSTVLSGLNGQATGVSTTGLTNLGNSIVTVIRVVGIVVAVVILLILGIKYMMGSAEEKADYKKSMIPYIIGAILIFAATAIVGVIYDMANGLNSSTTTTTTTTTTP